VLAARASLKTISQNGTHLARIGRTAIIGAMQSNNEHPKTALYWLLLAIQIAGAISFVWQELPEFGQVLNNPGEQLPKEPAPI
jgi:hypothetical protein